MKKNILTFVFVFIQMIAFSQARIGFYEWQIRADYPEQTFYSGYTQNDSIHYIFMNYDDFLVSYYFSKEDNTCYLTAIIPQTEEALNSLVQLYNSKYVIISSTEWMQYLSTGGILKIKLDAVNGTAVFYITSAK